MLNSKKHKQAFDRGYQAYLEGKKLSDNYYSALGRKNKLYASKWDAGWLQAKKDYSWLHPY